MENYNPMNGNYTNPNEFQAVPQEMPYGAPPMNPPYAGDQTMYMGAYRREEAVPPPPVQQPWQNPPQEFNPYAAPPAYGNPPQGYPGEFVPNNGYYAPPPNAAPMQPDYAYGNPPPNYPPDPMYAPYPPQQQKKSNPMMYVLVIIMSLCFIAVAALCIYFITDKKEDKGSREPSMSFSTLPTEEPSDPTETEPVPTETEADATETLPTETTTEAPETEPVTEPPTAANPYQYLDDLNSKYGNYFDFRPDENGNVIADSSTRLISKQELYGMTEHEVCIARNELYARHGYIFQTEWYNEYFKNFDWYKPTTTTLPTLNEIESENAKTIAAYESERGW